MGEETPNKLEENWRNPDGTWKEGHPSKGGRPKGKTLKEYVAEHFRTMSDEEKSAWIKEHKIQGIDQWKMGEGLPDSKSEVNNVGNPIIVLSNEIAGKYATPPSTSEDSQ